MFFENKKINELEQEIQYLLDKKKSITKLLFILRAHLALGSIDTIVLDKLPIDSSPGVLFTRLIKKIYLDTVNSNVLWFSLDGDIVVHKNCNVSGKNYDISMKNGKIKFDTTDENKKWVNALENKIYDIISNIDSNFYSTLFLLIKGLFGYGSSVCFINKYPISFHAEDLFDVYFKKTILGNNISFFMKQFQMKIKDCLQKFNEDKTRIVKQLEINEYDIIKNNIKIHISYCIKNEKGKYVYLYLLKYGIKKIIIEEKQSFFFDYIVTTLDFSLCGYDYGYPLCFPIISSLLKTDLIGQDIATFLEGLVQPPIAVSQSNAFLDEENPNQNIEQKINLNPGQVNILDNPLDLKVLNDKKDNSGNAFFIYKEQHKGTIDQCLYKTYDDIPTNRKSQFEADLFYKTREKNFTLYSDKVQNLIASIFKGLVEILLNQGLISTPPGITQKDFYELKLNIDFNFSLSSYKLQEINQYFNFVNNLGILKLNPDLINIENVLRDITNIYKFHDYLKKEQPKSISHESDEGIKHTDKIKRMLANLSQFKG